MKLVPILVCAAVVSATLAGCDSTGPKTVTRTVVDTVYQNDRFARNAPVVDGEWTISTATDTADGFFFQSTDTVTAFLQWQKSGSVTLTGTVTDSGLTLLSSSPVVVLFGNFTDSSASKKTRMSGTYVAKNTGIAWTGVRKL